MRRARLHPDLHLAVLIAWVALLGFFFANVEIQVEGSAGWAASLPTWRIERNWLLDIFWGSRAMTGYHAWVFTFMALFFHLPPIFSWRWSWRIEARIIACIMLFWLTEDFLWFVLNPAYGLARFAPQYVPWHIHWFWFAPTDYWTMSAAAVMLFFVSRQRKPRGASAAFAGAVNNLFCITPSLYRSAKLTRRDVPHLQALGIRKVVSLRAFHSDDRILAGSQIVLQRIPVNTWRIRDSDMAVALKVLRTVEEDGPVLIHCQHGADRTGLVCALYRVVYQGWSKAAALEELQYGGFGFHSIWRNIRRYLERVDIDELKRKIEG